MSYKNVAFSLMFKMLDKQGNSNWNANDLGNVRKNYKYSKVKSHLVFYKKTLNTEMEVVRILHEKMDIKNRIND